MCKWPKPSQSHRCTTPHNEPPHNKHSQSAHSTPQPFSGEDRGNVPAHRGIHFGAYHIQTAQILAFHTQFTSATIKHRERSANVNAYIFIQHFDQLFWIFIATPACTQNRGQSSCSLQRCKAGEALHRFVHFIFLVLRRRRFALFAKLFGKRCGGSTFLRFNHIL